MRVIVVGGGWAGLAAAMELCAHGADVTLIEAAGQLGGRARAVERNGLRFDNGQHLLIGAYRETLRLLATAGVVEKSLFARRPLHWLVHDAHRSTVEITAPAWLPAPLHMVWALLRAQGYTWRDRIAALRACAAVLNAPAGGDISVRDWLNKTRQPAHVADTLWAPLCLAALNTPVEYASAEVFTRVLRDAFLKRRTDADMLLARCDLGEVFPAPAAAFIRKRGGRIHLNERVVALIAGDGGINGVRSRRGEYMAGHVVLALPPNACAALLEEHPPLAALASRLATFGYEPICTAYLHFAAPLPFEAPMIGTVGSYGQWLFDLKQCGKPGWVAVVISGPGEHLHIGNAELLARLAEEIRRLFGTMPNHTDGFVIREKRATFSCGVGVNALRPATCTDLRGLWLAGDFTDTGYPATLEGAVRSGVSCAQGVLLASS